MNWAKLTAAQRTATVLNESLNEYRALGGINKAHSLQGAAGTTVNSQTLTSNVLTTLRQGFTVGGTRKNFISSNQSINTAVIGSTGQGAQFRFVVDENALDLDTPTTTTPN
jgi:hypothetical protein